MNSLAKEEEVILPWDRFGAWINCICVVTFDLELGQAMEMIFPKHIKLTDTEKTNICYLAFPDSNSGCMGDTQYHFRMRMTSPRKHYTLNNEEFDALCPTHLKPSTGHAFGYVYFRQVRDKTIRRGYFQKSIVIISPHCFVPLFQQVVSIIAPEYFDNGPVSLEAACHDIDHWPRPSCGNVPLNLPIMGTVLQVQLPTKGDKLSSGNQSSAEQALPPDSLALRYLPSAFEVNLFRAFLTVLPHLQLLWELVLTSQPILVMTPSPSICSEVVQALVSSVFPIFYATDYRPFFTIHDSEFKEYTTRTQAPPPLILGVTNPFFSKALIHWPNIIRIGDAVSIASKEMKKVKKTGNPFKSEEVKPGVYTRYKPFLGRDQALFKRIKKGVQYGRQGEIQTVIIRNFFLELTHSFMIPLERYVASLMPLQRTISPFKGVPNMGRFDMDDFFKSIEHNGPQLTSGLKGDWNGLYAKFFGSPNFAGWLTARQGEVKGKLEELHVDAMCRADLTNWSAEKQEVELVDMLIHLNEKIHLAKTREINLKSDQLSRLRDQVEIIMTRLPEDLRGVLRQSSSGSGAALSVMV